MSEVESLVLTVGYVTGIVLVVGAVPSLRYRAAIYSLPIPMTTVILGTRATVSSQQILGVGLLVGFFFVAGYLRTRRGINVYLSVGLATLLYIATAAILGQAPSFPVVAVSAVYVAAWIACLAAGGFSRAPSPPSVLHRKHTLTRVAAVLLASTTVVLAAELIGPFIVTFPYAGVPVALDADRDVQPFALEFARTSVSLVAFLATTALVEKLSGAIFLSVAAGWVAFLLVTLVLLVLARRRATSTFE